nr:MAG TPA: hypothetical protein [Caudoviricetes sp.]DAS02301.1 MAG TPA: hypothetical protein [Caudoviricetes sp.]
MYPLKALTDLSVSLSFFNLLTSLLLHLIIGVYYG